MRLDLESKHMESQSVGFVIYLQVYFLVKLNKCAQLEHEFINGGTNPF